MRGKRITAFFMALVMALSLLPTVVFAAAPFLLEGELKLKETIAVGDILTANYEKVIPEGLTHEDVRFLWQRKTPDDELLETNGEIVELKEIGKEKEYKVTEEDLGNKIVLTITGLEERGFSGSLTVTSKTVVEGSLVQEIDEALFDNMEIIEEIPYEEIPYEELPSEEISYEEEYYEEMPEDSFYEEEFFEEELYEEDYISEGIPVEEETYIEDFEEWYPENWEEETVPEIPEATNDGTWEENFEEEIFEEIIPEETEPLVYTAEAYAGENGVLDFGIVAAGEEGNVASQFATVVNTGTGSLNFHGISPEHFMVQDIVEPLEPGAGIELWIVPRGGILPGVYEDTITYTTVEGAEASFVAKVVIEDSVVLPEENVQDESGLLDEMIPMDGWNNENLYPLEDENSGGESTPEVTPEPEPPVEEITPTPEPPVEVTPTPEPPVEVTPTPEPVPVKPIIGLDMNAVDFGAKREGYQTLPDAAVITMANAAENSADVVLTAPISASDASAFSVSDYITVDGVELPGNILTAGNGVYFTVQPVIGLPQGEYVETFHIYNAEEDPNVREPLQTFTVSFKVKEPIMRSLVSSAKQLNFGNSEVGYGAVNPQQITITNNGNVTESVTASAGNYIVTVVGGASTELAPGTSVTFAVAPKTGLNVGKYNETIVIGSENVSVQLPVTFSVSDAAPVLTEIQNPEAVLGLPNGTKKEAAALKLPSSVVIKTTQGKMRARVSWDVKNCAYKVNSTEAQNFTVNGTVKLPEGVRNSNNIPLTAKIKVNVKGYTAKLASADNNRISGLTIDKNYAAQARISFAADGAGMDNTKPGIGDTRFVPYTWTVINTNTWYSAPYTATFGLAESGSYTLTVVFKQQKYNGSDWADTGKTDTKAVNFRVESNGGDAEVPGVTITPAVNQRNAVNTGDMTMILPFVIALIVAAAAIVVIFIYRKKR